MYANLQETAVEQQQRTTSPRSTSNSTTSSGYAASLIPSTMSPSIPHTRSSEPVAYSEAPVYPHTAPSLTYAYSVPTTQGQYTMSQEHLYPSSAGQQLPSAGLGRPSWDLASAYIDASPTMTTGSQGLAQHAAVDFKTEMLSPTTATTQQASGTARDVR